MNNKVEQTSVARAVHSSKLAVQGSKYSSTASANRQLAIGDPQPSTLNSQLSSPRLPREHAPAYEAFLVFRDLGQNRNLSEVARRTGRSLNTLGKWSAKFK